jgi:hypothetical protein
MTEDEYLSNPHAGQHDADQSTHGPTTLLEFIRHQEATVKAHIRARIATVN